MNTLFSSKQVFSVLALAALGVLAGSVSAQTADYRRGYDQGYRDAMEASRAQPGPTGPARGHMTVLDAKYGFRGDVCDALQAVQQIASMRRHVDVRANNDLCGDPASGRIKRLTIVYRCGDGPEQRVAGAEGSVLVMSCR
jgi:hypothetical protein